MDDIQKFIVEILEKASNIASDNFGKVTGTTKSDDNNQVLTETDLLIGHLIVNGIEKHYPGHNIIDEEAGVVDHNSDYTWVVDPIDGTSNFANGIPTYGIYLGLLYEDKPLAGGLAIPSFNEIYFAYKDNGCWCNRKRIRVSNEPSLLKSLVCYCIDGHQEDPERTRFECEILSELVLNIRNLRTSNSAFDVAQVLKGGYGAVLNQTSKIWDNVAAHLLIEEAGGKYTDFWGNELNYKNHMNLSQKNYMYCMGAPLIHSQIQKLLIPFRKRAKVIV